MRTLRVLLVALIGLLPLLGATAVAAQHIDDPSQCPEQSFCYDCIRLGGRWDQGRFAAGLCGGIFCCDEGGGWVPPDPATVPENASRSVEDRIEAWEEGYVLLPCWDTIRDLYGGTIYRLYRAAFDREPDALGFKYWVVAHLVGERLILERFDFGTTPPTPIVLPRVSLTAIAEHFVRSSEFRSRYGTLDDGAFLDRLYANVMDRTADAGGRAYWLGQMAAGMTRARVLLHFAESAEFRAMTAGGTPPGYPLDQQTGSCALGTWYGHR